MLAFYRRDRVTSSERDSLILASPALSKTMQAEWCYYVETNRELTEQEITRLRWLLAETFDPWGLRPRTHLGAYRDTIEIGPRLNFETPWAGTARKICHNVGLMAVMRIERSRRLGFTETLSSDERAAVLAQLCDRMTQLEYTEAPSSFALVGRPKPVERVPVLDEGIEALRRANLQYGLAMDEDDMARYLDLFAEQLWRDPTDVELFQLGVGNSEHSRHGFFRGRLELDGQPLNTSLMSIVKAPWKANPNNSVIAFHDDSSAIEGRKITAMMPGRPGEASPYVTDERLYHPTLTAETHNFPTGIAPYPGAATGSGGRIRDNQSVGRGGLVVASGVGYSVGNLHIPGYSQPWETREVAAPANLAHPLDILIEASNGASDYGNCFGEPLVLGHVRTFGQATPDGYRSWFKPIMYSEGVGMIDARHTEKGKPEASMLIVQLGGPAYRIGLSGGSASSLMSGDNATELDFDAVQRGDAEMEQRINRVMRVCIELGEANPIVSAHDLGAGGDSNALPEIVEPVGGRINLRALPVGDATLSVLEIWGNESQERNALLLRPEDLARFEAMCEREQAPMAVVGSVTGDGRLVLEDDSTGTNPVDLPLGPILGDIPLKAVRLTTTQPNLLPLRLPNDITVASALDRVLRLVSVGSKRWLIHKGDRSVSGLVAQQQGAGPLETPISDYAIMAHSLQGNSGTVLSQGERPLIGLISPGAQGRMTVAEAVTNLMGAPIKSLGDVRASANWMWAAKLEGEGAKLYEVAVAMSDAMTELGMAVDGGKDSLSMAAITPDGVVKAPGQLVIAPYAVVADIRQKVTADFKQTGNYIVLIDLSRRHARLGGSALAQAYGQTGNSAPDLTDMSDLGRAFEAVQSLIKRGLIQSIHDRSDGGLITTVLEMAFAGNRGLQLSLPETSDLIAMLFNEEAGVVLEVTPGDAQIVADALREAAVPAQMIGVVGAEGAPVHITCGKQTVLDRPLHELRAIWEATSSQLEKRQTAPEPAAQEATLHTQPRVTPRWNLSFTPSAPAKIATDGVRPAVAILRSPGTNGDRELAASFLSAGFETWDVTMNDIMNGRIRLDAFRGVAFPGGFSYGDVLDSGKGWAGVIRFNDVLAKQFADFYARPDTFSFGVCNGAQLMTLLGWVPWVDKPDDLRPRFIKNASGKFESRFVTVEILSSPAIMLKGMAGSRMGVWVAHGEGRLEVPEAGLMNDIRGQQLSPIRFVEPDGGPTQTYPFNPNGSADGMTALCSPDGRHLAMMPHPERLSSQLWQWPWLPPEWADLAASPWAKLFQNAREWCD